MATSRRGERNKATVKPAEHAPRPAVDQPPPKKLRRRSETAIAAAEAAAVADHAAAVETCHVVVRNLSKGNSIVEEYDGVYDPDRVSKNGPGTYQVALVRPTGTETIVQVVR